MPLDTDILDNVCTTEQLRLLCWVQFLATYRERLDLHQLQGYLELMSDSRAGKYPPPNQSPSDLYE